MAKHHIRLDRLKPIFKIKDGAVFETRLAAVQKRLLIIQQAYLMQNRKAVIVFEGTDAAGKGGLIRRLSAPLDPRFCKVWPITAPTEAERREHYLERFWRRLPPRGSIAVFDRSWYGRVLVERVEGLIPKPDWKRAYEEINTFERLLIEDGAVLVKIFLQIDAETQAERFIERLTVPYKRWKITARDFEARRFAGDYAVAYQEMMDRTSTRHAPWAAFQGEPKWAARIAALELIAKCLSKGVDLSPPTLDPALLKLAQTELGVPFETPLG